MKTRGCTSQRKTTKVRLAPQPGQGPGAGSGPPRPAPARGGTVPAELPRAPPPRQSGGTRARTPRDQAENSRPSPSRAGFFGACVSYEIPGEGGKVPQVSASASLFHVCPESPTARAAARREGGAGVLQPRRLGSLASLGARQGARARTPHQAGPAPGPPPGVLRASRGPCSGQRARREAQGAAGADASLRLTPTAHLHPPASPLSLTPRVPTPRVFLFAPTYRLAPEDVSGKSRRCVGFAFSCLKEIKGVPSPQAPQLPSVLQASPSWASSVTSSPCEGRKAFK